MQATQECVTSSGVTPGSIPITHKLKKDKDKGSMLPEKQSILDAIEHLFAKYLEIRPLFFLFARPINDEWKMSPYFGVLPFFFRALEKIIYTLSQ